MLEQVDVSLNISKNEYNKLIEPLGYRLGELQRQCKEAGIPIVVVYEGWDAAGKAGSVNQLMRLVDPRRFKVHGIELPNESERVKPFLWRFAIRMPPRGSIAVFIRSWYTRVLVERVEGHVPEKEWRSAYDDINSFERQLVDDGTVILKFWLHISKKEQRQRLEELKKDPYDSWRAKPANWETHNQYKSYVEAVEEMLQKTSNPFAPWTIIEAEDVCFGRLKTYETLARVLESTLADRERLAKVKKSYGFHVDPSAYCTIVLKSERFLKRCDLTKKIEDRKEYKERLDCLQMKARQMHNRLALEGTAAVAIFEGWDASGKGGAIKRLVAQLDARRFEVVSTFAPTNEELAQHYLWRFWRNIPKNGYLTIFDRSWYGRVLVERVEATCPTEAWQRAYNEINEFEKMLVDDGIIIVKFWLQIDKDEQLKRFKTREEIPYKKWKITEEDWRNRGKWEEYEMAVADMIQKTSTTYAPWTVVASNDKYYSRIQVLETFLETVSVKLDEEKSGNGSR